jgi:GH25 family lysozyme M1 (1,4-beta-N-acetylmuramidase)
MNERTWGIDISGYQNWVDSRLLEVWREKGASFAFIRMGRGTLPDPNFTQLLSRFGEGWTLGGYWWFDPTLSPRAQVEKALQVFEQASPKVTWIALDCEQYWTRWEEYWLKKITHIFKPSHLESFYLEVAERVRSAIPDPIIYTAPWFVRSYAPKMSSWLPDYRLWLAWYPYRSRRYQSWEEFSKIVDTLVPSFPSWGQAWEFWQFADNHSFLPGGSRGVDLNIRQPNNFSSPSYLYRARVTASPSLRVRAGPSLSAKILDHLTYGAFVSVISETTSENLPWAQIEKDRWVCAKYLQRII